MTETTPFKAPEYSLAQLKENGLTEQMLRDIKRFMANNAEDADNSTVLAEMAADEFDHEEWLHQDSHPIWELAFEYFGDD